MSALGEKRMSSQMKIHTSVPSFFPSLLFDLNLNTSHGWVVRRGMFPCSLLPASIDIAFTSPGRGGQDTSHGDRWSPPRAERFDRVCPCSSVAPLTCTWQVIIRPKLRGNDVSESLKLIR